MTRTWFGTGIVVALLTAAGPIAAPAQRQPPIQGPADAACRDQARAEVFTAPNPDRLSLWDLGSRIWHTCMAAHHASAPNPDRAERRF